jgi:hypothetical protein
MEQLRFIARITEVPEPRDAHADASIAGLGHDICQEQVRHLQTQQYMSCQYDKKY